MTEVQFTHHSICLLQACIIPADSQHTWPHARRPPKTFRYMASFAPPYSSVCYCIQYISHKKQLKAGKVCLVHSLRQYSPSQQGGMATGSGNSHVSTVKKQGHGSFFTHPETPKPQEGASHIQSGSLPSVKPFWKHPHRNTQGCVSVVILYPAKNED